MRKIRRKAGYATCRASGLSPERLIAEATRQGIGLYDIKQIYGGLTEFSVAAIQVGKAKELANKLGYELQVVHCGGAEWGVQRLWKRKVLLIGIVVRSWPSSGFRRESFLSRYKPPMEWKRGKY